MMTRNEGTTSGSSELSRSSPTMTYITAISRNNQAVRLYEKQMFDAAGRMFGRALDGIREAVGEMNSRIHPMVETRKCQYKDSPRMCIDRLQQTNEWNPADGDRKDNSDVVLLVGNCGKPFREHTTCEDRTASFFYRSAILIVPIEHGSDVDAKPNNTRNKDNTVIGSGTTTSSNFDTRNVASTNKTHNSFAKESATIVYNLGLVHHTMGLHLNSTVHLRQAVRFYTVAASIQNASNLWDEPLLRIALLNNLGQAYTEFFDYRSAKLCFQLLSEELDAAVDQLVLHNMDCTGFIFNVLLQEPILAGAA